MHKLKPINLTKKPNQKPAQILKLIQIDKKFSLMNTSSKYKVSELLQRSLDYLLGKKQRQQMKKNKLKQIQSQFEIQRDRSMTKMKEKISRSDKLRKQSLNDRQVKVNQDLQLVDSKIKSNKKKYEQQINKMMQTRKSYIKNNHSQSRISKASSNRSINKSFNFHDKSHIDNTEDIDNKIFEIEEKINQAKTNQKFYHQQKVQRAKFYSKDVKQTMSKINARLESEEKQCFSGYYKTSTKILRGQERSRQFYISQSQKKKKLIEQKFKKCSQNLRHLQTQREQKFQKIQQTFNRIIKPKTWKNEKHKAYLEILDRNKIKLQLQKQLKAEAIMKRHIDIGLTNRALKEQKEKIISCVKTNEKVNKAY